MARSKPKKKPGVIPQEHGSPWLQQHTRVVVDETMAAGVTRARVIHQCVLDWYSGKALINDNQRDAGLRFRADWEIAVVSAGVVGAYEQAITGASDFTESQVKARARVRKVIAKLGSIPVSVLISVCVENQWAGDWEKRRSWPSQSGMALLRDALTDLAKHYGLTGGRETG